MPTSTIRSRAGGGTPFGRLKTTTRANENSYPLTIGICMLLVRCQRSGLWQGSDETAVRIVGRSPAWSSPGHSVSGEMQCSREVVYTV
jgi:hypothetical protein